MSHRGSENYRNLWVLPLNPVTQYEAAVVALHHQVEDGKVRLELADHRFRFSLTFSCYCLISRLLKVKDRLEKIIRIVVNNKYCHLTLLHRLQISKISLNQTVDMINMRAVINLTTISFLPFTSLAAYQPDYQNQISLSGLTPSFAAAQS